SIGNFYDDTHTDTLKRRFSASGNISAYRAYTFIDDIYVGYDSTQDHNGINEVVEKDIAVYPNPANTRCTINLNGYYFQSISIVNMLGSQVYFDDKLNTTKKEIDVSQFPTGSYIIQFNSSQTKFNKKINIIHQ
ncbi:MAG: Secretion system C-terminal sorting domain, partial [Bacteroidota bacterium]